MPRADESALPLSRRDRVTLALALFLALAGGTIVAGWVYRIPVLRGSAFGTFVAPNTALLFILVGVSAASQVYRMLRWAGVALGALAATGGALFIAEHLSGVNLGIDTLFLRSALRDWTVAMAPGRIAWPTALSFLLAGICLIYLRSEKSVIPDVCAAGVLSIGFFASLGYLYGIEHLYGRLMALPTVALHLVMAVMLFAAAPYSRFAELFLSTDAGGIVLRRMSAVVLVLFPLLGWVCLRLERWDAVGLEAGTAILVVATIFLFAGSALLTANHLNRLDTELKHVQQGLIRTEKLAAAGRLAATVAHEINNPLAAALNLVYLARTSAPEQARELMQMAERELTRVAAVARQSLGFYRAQNRAEVVDVNATVGEVLGVYGSSASAKGVELEHLGADHVAVFVEPGELRQMLLNLVANAVDATDSGGRVVIATRRNWGNTIEVVVSDEGCGIPPEVREHIFEPFFTTKDAVGTGLGLFVVQELVSKYQGRLTFDTATGPDRHGTTFTLTLPAAEEQTAAARATGADGA